jgi:outer membrane receptor for ferric coprogen and ferric-rhodotorulic acid
VSFEEQPFLAAARVRRMRRLVICTGATLCIAAVPASHAQTAETAAKEAPRTMPTVRVDGKYEGVSEGTGSYTTDSTRTATGLNLSLRDTPQSVTIVTRERMDDQAVTTAADALQFTTGVSLKPVDRGRNNLSVRGFEIQSFQFDGIPVATGNIGIETTNAAIYDRLEVVRGATGLITGAGEPSAAVNLVRKHADSKAFTGSIDAETGSWDRRGVTVDVSTPLNESGSVRARVVASGAEQDAFIDLESTQNTVFYAVLDADLSEATRLSLGASDQRDERDGVLWAGLPYWYSDGTRTNWDRSKTSATDWNEWDTRERTAFLSVEHQFANNWSLRGDATHYRQYEDSKMLWMWGAPDRETGEGMEVYPYHYVSEPKQTNLSLIATGPLTLWGREHELTAGLVHSRRKGGWTNRDAVSELAPVGNFNVWDGSYPEPQLGERYLGSMTTHTQTGVYSAARLQLSDRFKLIAGGRFTNWKQEDEAGVWTAAAFEIEHEGVFTPYAGIVYDLTQQISAYASYADIFNPSTNKDRNGAYLDPREGSNYEVGLKGEFLDGWLNASAAVFYVDQDNYAVPDVGFFVPGTIEPASRAAQGTKTEGYELELVGALTRNWQIGAGWTHYSAKDAEDVDVAVDHPRRLLKVFTKYALQGPLSGLSIGGGLHWESAKPARDINPATGEEERVGQPSYGLVDLMAKYALQEQVSVQLNVNNVLDEKYRSSSYWWGAPYTYGEPRNIVVSLDYSF